MPMPAGCPVGGQTGRVVVGRIFCQTDAAGTAGSPTSPGSHGCALWMFPAKTVGGEVPGAGGWCRETGQASHSVSTLVRYMAAASATEAAALVCNFTFSVSNEIAQAAVAL